MSLECLEGRRLLSAVPLVSTTPHGATPLDTGEYLLGRVAVTPVLLESNGQVDPSSENWTAEEISHVLSNVAAGTQWWVDMLGTLTDRHSLEFVIDDRFAVDPHPSPFEPISRPSDDYPAYVGQFLTDQGFGDLASLQHAMLAFNHAQREALGTDWAFTLFIVDSSNDAAVDDGRFATGGTFSQAFAFAGGLFFITPSGRPASTYAHELGHIFWARDEYPGGGSWIDRRGYYNTQNTNAADNPDPDFVQQTSIMSAGEDLRRAYEEQVSPASTLAMVGWQDSDGDGVFDVLDVPLELAISAVYVEETQTLRVVGTASAVALPSANSSGLQNDITLNRISRLEYRVGGGNWVTAATPDAQQARFDTSIPLKGEFTTVELRVVDATTGITSETVVVPRDRPAGSEASISGFLFVDSDGDSVWDADESLISSAAVELVAATVPRGRVEPDEFANGTIDGNRPGIQIAASGPKIDSRLGAFAGDSSSIAEFHYFDLDRFQWENRWNFRAGRQFIATLEQPTSDVQITAVGGGKDSYARLQAYDIDGNLIGRQTVGPLGVGQSATLSVHDPAGTIHQIIAAGHASTNVGLDDLRFGPSTTATADALGRFSLSGLPDGTYTLDVQPQLSIHDLPGGPLELTVAGGVAVPLAVPLAIVPSPWRNPANHLDSNNDGWVGPLDALLVINDLNRTGARILGGSDPGAPFVDVNGDGLASPIDALQVINFLNRGSVSGEGSVADAESVERSSEPGSGAEFAAPLESWPGAGGPPLGGDGPVSSPAAAWPGAVDDFFAEGDFDFAGTFSSRRALNVISSEFGTDAHTKLDKLKTLDKLGAIDGLGNQSLMPAALESSGVNDVCGPG